MKGGPSKYLHLRCEVVSIIAANENKKMKNIVNSLLAFCRHNKKNEHTHKLMIHLQGTVYGSMEVKKRMKRVEEDGKNVCLKNILHLKR